MSSNKDLIHTVQSSTLEGIGDVDTHKQELAVVASYNWLDCSTPTIMVPGEQSSHNQTENECAG
jgi:hypothetical protein